MSVSLRKLTDRKKVLVDIIRNDVAKNGGASVLSDTKLLTIVDGLEKEYRVVIEFGSHYALIDEEDNDGDNGSSASS